MGWKSIFGKKKKKTTTSSLPQPLSLPPTKIFDRNGEGKITCSDLGSVMKMLGQPAYEEEEVRNMIQEFDSDGDGYINLDDFIQVNTNGLDSEELLESLQHAFIIFDLDQNGSISAHELHVVMGSLGDGSSIEDCRKMIAVVDNDGDGEINFDEFKKMMIGGGSNGTCA